MFPWQANPGTLKHDEMHTEIKEKLEKTNVDFGKAAKAGMNIFGAAQDGEPKSARLKSCLAEMDTILQTCVKAHTQHTHNYGYQHKIMNLQHMFMAVNEFSTSSCG